MKKLLKEKKMTKTEILANIRENGGFHNWQNWNRKEIKTWIKWDYGCTDYTANEVSYHLI